MQFKLKRSEHVRRRGIFNPTRVRRQATTPNPRPTVLSASPSSTVASVPWPSPTLEIDTDSEGEADGDSSDEGELDSDFEDDIPQFIPNQRGDAARPSEIAAAASSSAIASISNEREGRMGEMETHVLIAGGSIGGTLLVILIAYSVWFARKRGVSVAHVLATPARKIRDRRRRRPPSPEYGWSDWQNPSEVKEHNLYAKPSAATSNPFITPPQAAIVRKGSFSSEKSPTRPKQGHFSAGSGFGLPSRPDQMKKQDDESKSPVDRHLVVNVPVANGSSDQSAQAYGPSLSRDLNSEEEPAPTFREFLTNRRISQPKISHFSWTNSQAAPTPHDPLSRFSVATSVSSIARFRTVDSWVANQAGRVENQRQRQKMLEKNPVPDLPEQYRQPRMTYQSDSEATVFRQHPGSEMVIDRGSIVPSEVLDTKVKPRILSEDHHRD